MSLLAPHEPPAVTVVHPDSRSPFFFTCDHASRRVPASLGDLGVPASEWERHIAWDIGALAVAEHLAGHFSAPLVASGYSRLVIDCNRQLWRHDCIPEVSELTPVPGNCNLDEAERTRRIEALHRPYHETITRMLDARAAATIPTLYLAIHSFTPVYKGEQRPWQVALLSNRDRRVAEILMRELRHDPALVVGDNIPYRLTDETDYGVPVHAERRGLPHVLIELRQDEIADERGQRAWAERLIPLLEIAARETLSPPG
ncbi:MAG: N-formylglutamate amidohydrolase [Gammaproteobacteria bacterium]|nr:N-formylglutamate amidohydrolase [Gammaproteobacteria bacterium]